MFRLVSRQSWLQSPLQEVLVTRSSLIIVLSLVASITACRHPSVDIADTGIGHDIDGSDRAINVTAPTITPATVDTGDVVVEDSGDTATSEPCKVSVDWNVETPIVTPSTFVMPRLEVSSTCDLPIGLRGIGLELTGGMWIKDLTDNRIGVGTRTQHLNVYQAEVTCTDIDCTMTWAMNISEYGVYFTPDESADIGFSVAAFFLDEQIAEIEELWDKEDDNIHLEASIVFNADNQAGGALIAETDLTIRSE